MKKKIIVASLVASLLVVGSSLLAVASKTDAPSTKVNLCQEEDDFPEAHFLPHGFVFFEALI